MITENLCPSSAVGGGSTLNAGFAGNGKAERTLPYGSRALIRGRVLGAGGNGVAGASVCVEGHVELPGRAYELLGTATTNQNGGWSYELRRGASRAIRVAYRFGATQTSTDLSLAVRADAALDLSKNLIRPHRRVFFSGAIPGPLAAKRVVIVCGTVPGARRRFLVRRARTNAWVASGSATRSRRSPPYEIRLLGRGPRTEQLPLQRRAFPEALHLGAALDLPSPNQRREP